MAKKASTDDKSKKLKRPPTPSQAEGDERTVNKALKNKDKKKSK